MPDDDRRYRVVYFTELNDHNRDTELNRCLAGESFYSGFLSEASRKDARAIISSDTGGAVRLSAAAGASRRAPEAGPRR